MVRSYLLAKDNKVSTIKDATLESQRVRVIKQGCRYLIILVAKTRVSTFLEEKTLKDALRSYDVNLEAFRYTMLI